MGIVNRYVFLFFLFVVIISMGCRGSAPSTYHIREDVDFSFIKKVAVLPFDNLTPERSAGELVRQIVVSELLASGLVDVVVPGEVNATLKSLNIKSTSSLSKNQIKTIGNTLQVQAVILGVVEKFGDIRTGNISSSELTITLMMADTSAGSILWSVTKTGGGAGFMARHFGTKTKTMSETVLSVVREAIETFTEY